MATSATVTSIIATSATPARRVCAFWRRSRRRMARTGPPAAASDMPGPPRRWSGPPQLRLRRPRPLLGVRVEELAARQPLLVHGRDGGLDLGREGLLHLGDLADRQRGHLHALADQALLAVH